MEEKKNMKLLKITLILFCSIDIDVRPCIFIFS